MRHTSKSLLKLRTIFEEKIWKTLGKAVKVVIFLGALSCIGVVAVVLFGLKFDKHEFIHSEISTPFSFLLSIFEPGMHTF